MRATIQLILALGVLAFSGDVCAQTAPLPLPFSGTENGFLTRGDWLLSVAPMASGDPQFAWSVRQRFDVDVAHFPRGRVNLFFDNEIVMGRERREFDFNHGNVMFETSALAQLAGIDAALVFYHMSRHLIDRPIDRVVAYHTVGGRVERVFTIGRSTVAPAAELHRVVQRTFVDYQWLSQFTLRPDHPFDKVALDLYAAFERRVDAFPLARVPLSWFEAGFRLASPGNQ